jgi:hypothetical protein
VCYKTTPALHEENGWLMRLGDLGLVGFFTGSILLSSLPITMFQWYDHAGPVEPLAAA